MTQPPQKPSTSAPSSSSASREAPKASVPDTTKPVVPKAPPKPQLEWPSWINDPAQVLARTAWGENRGGGHLGMQSVINSVLNRVAKPKWWGKDILTVCLKPWQYSTWNPLIVMTKPDANYLATVAVALDDPQFQMAMGMTQAALLGKLPDITGGADSYHDMRIEPPNWTKSAEQLVDIAGQRFYRVA